jgi:hypothetical protein
MLARTWTSLTLISALSVALVACSSDEKEPGGDQTGFDNPGDGSGAGNGSSGGAGTIAAGGFDPDTEICKHIDMIIAVDGSSSMTEELQAIRDEVFPSFADRLLQISGGIEDFRVGTIDACPNPANYHTRGKGGECNFAGGKPWIESTSPNMRIFQADQQCSGNDDDEQPASAAARSLETMFASGPNAGFSRPEALLVVVAITDEDEQPTGSADTAQEVYDRLVAAKGGEAQRIVFLGIGGARQCLGPYGTADHAQKLQEVTQLFATGGHGVFWDLCQGRLADGLEQAYKIIENACNDLPPPPAVPPPTSDGPE